MSRSNERTKQEDIVAATRAGPVTFAAVAPPGARRMCQYALLFRAPNKPQRETERRGVQPKASTKLPKLQEAGFLVFALRRTVARRIEPKPVARRIEPTPVARCI